MRLLTWNCQGGFHRKIAAIDALRPDLAIIQECECPDNLRARVAAWQSRPIVWCGDSSVKGLAVISFTDAQLKVDGAYHSSLKHLLPVLVTGPRNFRLMAVWTKEGDEQRARYIGQAVLGVQRYTPFTAGDVTVVAGDFTSSQIWDRVVGRTGMRKWLNSWMASAWSAPTTIITPKLRAPRPETRFTCTNC